MASRSPLDWQPPVMPSGLAPAARPAAPTGFMENARASAEEMRIAGNIGSSDRNLAEAYAPILEALDHVGATYEGRSAQGAARLHYLNPYQLTEDPLANPYGVDVPGRSRMRAMLWEEVRRQQAQGRLRDLPDTPEAFERQANQAVRGRLERIRDVQSRATTLGTIGGFAGGVAGSFEDPVVVASLPVGGEARTLLGGVAQSVITNMVVVGLSQPSIRQNYAQLGEDMSLEDSVRSVLFAGGAGGAFHLGAGAVGAGYRGIRAGVRRLLPETHWTEGLRAAVNVVEREDEMHQASPFEPGQAGDTAHVEALQDALDRLQREARPAAPAPVAAAAPGPRETSPAPAPRRAAAEPHGDDLTAIDDYMRHVRRHESSGNDAIDNPTPGQTAGGRFQFTDGTFRSYYRRLYGTDPGPHPSPALKHDGAIQERLMRALTADNAASLRQHGFAVDRGNLFLLHFLGPEDGIKVLRAEPGTRVEGLIHGESIAANPTILPRRTAGDVIAWSHRAMGGRAPEIRAGAAAPEAVAGAAAAVEGDAAGALADAEGLALSRDLEREPGAAEAVPAYESAPVLRRDLFGSDAEWHAAQDRLDREFAGRAENGAPESGSGAPGRETALGGAEGPAAEIASEGAVAAADAAPVSFRTSKGSTYAVEADGTTTRDKAYRPEHGVAEQGIQPTSQATYYVSREQAKELGLFQAEGGGRMSIEPLGDGRIGVRYLDGPDAGKFEKRTVARPAAAPAVGLVPIETWSNGTKAHFGNDIVEVASGREGLTPAPELATAMPHLERGAEALKQFDDPDAGDGAKLQVDSVTHDLRMDAEAADAGGQHYQIDDAGEAKPLAEILDDIDRQRKAADAIRGCLK